MFLQISQRQYDAVWRGSGCSIVGWDTGAVLVDIYRKLPWNVLTSCSLYFCKVVGYRPAGVQDCLSTRVISLFVFILKKLLQRWEISHRLTSNLKWLLYRVIQEESAVLWEMIACVIISKKVHMNMGPILDGYRDMVKRRYGPSCEHEQQLRNK